MKIKQANGKERERAEEGKRKGRENEEYSSKKKSLFGVAKNFSGNLSGCRVLVVK